MPAHSFTVDLTFTLDDREGSFGERCIGAEVEYSYIPTYGDGRNEPREPAHCIIESVTVKPLRGNDAKAIDILDWLTDDQIEALERAALQDWRDRDDDARERAAEARDEERFLMRAGL